MHGLTSITGDINESAPAGFEDPFLRTGRFGVGSAVYLGNGYILTAAHVSSASAFIVNGINHQVIAGTQVDLSNNGTPGLSALSDVSLIRVRVPEASALQGLPILSISQTSSAGANTPGVIIGEGRGQTTTAPVDLGAEIEGYDWGTTPSRDLRWADVLISNSDNIAIDANGRDIVGMASFAFTETAQRGHATNGDSGGGLFITGDTGPELAGIIHAVTFFPGQAATSSGFGNKTLFSDLSFYADQINVVEGDLTGDGYVGDADLQLVLGNWGNSVLAGDWFAGDATGDGVVGRGDLDYVLDNWGAGTIPAPSVPAPATGAVLGLLALGLLHHRRDSC